MIRTLTANPSFDLTYQVDEFRVGEVNLAGAMSIAAAGKGVNVARNVVANGTPATAIVPGNSLDGSAFVTELNRHDVTCEVVPRDDSTRRNVTIVTGDGATSKINEAGAPVGGELTEALLDAAIAQPDAPLAACGSLAPGTDPGFYVALAERLPAPERTLALDTSGSALRAFVGSPCLLAKPNRAELEQLVDSRLVTYGDLIDAADDLVAQGWRNVLVSLGPAGAVLVNNRGVWAGAAPLDDPLNTVGAGDALVSGFLLAPEADWIALSFALALARSAVLSYDTAGMRMTSTDRAAVQQRHVDRSQLLEEDTG